MGIKDRIEEWKLLVKNDRRIMAIGGLSVVVIVLFAFTQLKGNEPPQEAFMTQTRRQELAAQQEASEQSLGETEAYNDLIKAFQQDIQTLKTAAENSAKREERDRREFEDHRRRAKGIFETVVNKIEELTRAVEDLETAQSGGPGVLPGVAGSYTGANGEQIDGTISGGEVDSLSGFGFDEATVPPPPQEPKPVRVAVISPGDSVPITLLTGVNAPVDGTPYPVVFRLDGPITGPDGSTLDLGEARLIGAAQGSETDGRVIFRLTDLAIRHPDGRRSVVQVDGWIVGEDGVRGMKGKLIDKLGRLIAATAGYSFIAALGERIDNSASAVTVSGGENVTVKGDDISVAGASALTDASNRLGQILLDRYEKLVPVVEVLSGRTVAAVFSRTAEVTIVDENLDGEGLYYASLD